jgi:hypothetical protein
MTVTAMTDMQPQILPVVLSTRTAVTVTREGAGIGLVPHATGAAMCLAPGANVGHLVRLPSLKNLTPAIPQLLALLHALKLASINIGRFPDHVCVQRVPPVDEFQQMSLN